MSKVIFNPIDSKYKSIVGGVDKESKFSLSIDVARGISIGASVHLRKDDRDTCLDIVMNKVSSDNVYDRYSVDVSVAEEGLYWYFFSIFTLGTTERFIIRNGVKAVLSDDFNSCWQLTVRNKTYQSPSWMNGKVMYHIFVDRFNKVGKIKSKANAIMRNWGEIPNWLGNGQTEIVTTDFFGGNLKGITAKLDYLKSLNVGIIYLSPIFEAVSNHKYDTGNYGKIDPMFGTTADFKALCSKAKELGIYVMLDGVFNHTGSNSRYFNREGSYKSIGAYQSQSSPYYTWYRFKQFPESYDCWWDFKTLPSLNHKSKELQKYLCNSKTGIIGKWIKLGASGYRLDVVDELDNELLDKIRSCSKQAMPNSLLLGEVWEDASNKIAYGSRRRYFTSDQLDSAMNYPLRSAILEYVTKGNSQLLEQVVFDMHNNLNADVLNQYMNILSTHDTARILTTLNGDTMDNVNKLYRYASVMSNQQYDTAVKMLKVASVLQYTLCGVPSVFYGDEVGIQGCQDPYCRKCFPWGNEDKQLLEHYKLLGNIRNLDCFATATFSQIMCKDGVYAFKRSGEKDSCIVISNANNFTQKINISARGIELFSSTIVDNIVEIPAMSAIIVSLFANTTISV